MVEILFVSLFFHNFVLLNLFEFLKNCENVLSKFCIQDFQCPKKPAYNLQMIRPINHNLTKDHKEIC